ncbi:MAG: SH3 domain-containing protein [Leptolyngbyaceae cyanobacterium SM2_5_2]|nr:SH3 domain-containing protein [Leptolyngbyaceae cyanobacterium SM2_5_2]
MTLALAGVALGSSCRTSPEIATEAGPSAVAVDTEQATANSPVEETIGGFTATVIDPPRVTTLATQQSGAQINLRSQPTTLSPIVGNGQSGDSVQLLRLAEGEGGYSWYYVQFTQSDTEGWIRGDFVDVDAAQATTPASANEEVTQPVVATTTQPCSRDRQEAFFETKSLTIYLCNTPEGLRYLGTNKTTQESLETDDVTSYQGLYIAIDGPYQHHISDTTVAVYQVNNGSYSQLNAEPVLRFERFVLLAWIVKGQLIFCLPPYSRVTHAHPPKGPPHDHHPQPRSLDYSRSGTLPR